nr:hypothetical protein [Mycoplasmopsis bovis]QQH19071.1 hypothetical protein HYE48_02365 [Mycoplasmopsis bovis]
MYKKLKANLQNHGIQKTVKSNTNQGSRPVLESNSKCNFKSAGRQVLIGEHTLNDKIENIEI